MRSPTPRQWAAIAIAAVALPALTFMAWPLLALLPGLLPKSLIDLLPQEPPLWRLLWGLVLAGVLVVAAGLAIKPHRRLGCLIVAAWAVASLAVAAIALIAWRALGSPSLEPVTGLSPRHVDAIATRAFAIIAGLGGVALLVISYRRQRTTETGERREVTKLFNERFTAAYTELGNEHAAVRLGAVNALAHLADDAPTEQEAQMVIDVLCAYLRMPYTPAPGQLPDGAVEERTTRHHERELEFASFREVRHTIIRIIGNRLREHTRWRGKDYDFTGVVFDGGSLYGADFTGGEVTFRQAKFIRGKTDFSDAAFTGGTVSFSQAKFAGGTVSFSGAEFAGAGFAGGKVDFSQAEFTGGTVDFNQAEFAGRRMDFSGAAFTGGTVSFHDAVFTGGTVDFNQAKFAGGKVDFSQAEFTGKGLRCVSFDGAEFSGGEVSFREAAFTGGTVSFNQAEFAGATLSFFEVRFAGGEVSFREAAFTGGTVDFNQAEFISGEAIFGETVSFPDAAFTGGTVSFNQAKFAGGRASFFDAQFSGGEVSFGRAAFTGGTVDFNQAEFTGGTVDFNQAEFSGGEVSFQYASGRCPINLLEAVESGEPGVVLLLELWATEPGRGRGRDGLEDPV